MGRKEGIDSTLRLSNTGHALLIDFKEHFGVSVTQMHLSLVSGGWCQPGGRPNILLRKPDYVRF